MGTTQIKKKLDLIAKHINDLDSLLKVEYGQQAYIYFESEGMLYAMNGGDDIGSSSQTHVIEKSKPCCFDCGAW